MQKEDLILKAEKLGIDKKYALTVTSEKLRILIKDAEEKLSVPETPAPKHAYYRG